MNTEETKNGQTTLVFATNNAHKLEEIREILGEKFHIVSLKELGCQEDIPEEQDTLEGNALQKARYIRDKYKVNCFADDTGLEIEALGGEPGVYSARYAGDGHDSEANITSRNIRVRTYIFPQFIHESLAETHDFSV